MNKYFCYYLFEKQVFKKSLRPLPLIIFLFVLTISSYGQTGKGTISGTVIDSSGAGLPYASIVVKSLNKGTSADAHGSFSLKNVPVGNQIIIIQMFGFNQVEIQVEVKDGENTNLSLITLSQNVHEVEEVFINEKSKYKVDNTSQSLRLQTPILEVPQNIQVVSKAMLKDQQVTSMSDGLIRNVSGLVRAEHWGDLYTNVNARGSQIQAFRNGFNVVNSYWGPLTEDMSFVDHIEFVKGPAGFMLSSGDPSGLYNVVTKKPTGVNKGEANFTLGSYNLYRTSLDLDGKLSNNGRVLYRLNLSAQNKGSFRPNEYNNRYVIAPVISYQLDDKTKVTAEYNYQRADMSNVGSYYIFSPDGFAKLPRNSTQLPAGLPGTKINDHSLYLTLQHEFNKNWKITAQAALFVYLQEGTSMWPTSVARDGKMIRSVSIWDAKSTMTMAQIFVNGNVKTGSVNHKILSGLDMGTKDYIADWSQSHDLDTLNGGEFDPNNPNLGKPINGYTSFDRSKPLSERAGGSTQTMNYSAFYLQDELGFFENKLRLTLAGRYTSVSQMYYSPNLKADHITPRVGVSASVTKETAIYGLYDQAFIPQNAGTLVGGGKVKPITGNNMEVGVKREWFGGKWNTTLALYRILKNNEVVSVSPTAPIFMEIGQKRAQGIEFDLRGQIVKGLNLIANYAYTDSRVIKVEDGVTTITKGQLLPTYAKHTINGWLTYKIQSGFAKGFGVSAGYTALLDRVTYWDSSPDGAKLAQYYKADAGLFWENDRMKIAGNMFNVFDANLYSGSYYAWLKAYYTQYEPGRNVRLLVNYKF